MSATLTAYTFFDVAPDCSQDELHHAYNSMVARHHPDKTWSTPTAAASKTGMQEVKRWYGLVATKQARAAYDRQLAQARAAGRDCYLQEQPPPPPPKEDSSTKRAHRCHTQVVLARPPAHGHGPVAVFCNLLVVLAQGVAGAAGWALRTPWCRVLRRALASAALALLVLGLVYDWRIEAGAGVPCLLPSWAAANRHYKVLGLRDGSAATPFAAVRKAYHRALRQYHPDKWALQMPLQASQACAIDATGLLADVTAAYQVLRDPHMRCLYDQQQQHWFLRGPVAACDSARPESIWTQNAVVSTAEDAVVLWRAGQVTLFQTLQSVWVSMWASLQVLADGVRAWLRKV